MTKQMILERIENLQKYINDSEAHIEWVQSTIIECTNEVKELELSLLREAV